MFDNNKKLDTQQILNYISIQKILSHPKENADFVIPRIYLNIPILDEDCEVVNAMNLRPQQIASAEKKKKIQNLMAQLFELTDIE